MATKSSKSATSKIPVIRPAAKASKSPAPPKPSTAPTARKPALSKTPAKKAVTVEATAAAVKKSPDRLGKGDKVRFTFHTAFGPSVRSGKLAERLPEKGRVKVLFEGAIFRPWSAHVVRA